MSCFIGHHAKDKSTIAAATVESGFKLEKVPARVTDPDAMFEAINAIVPLDNESFYTSVKKKNDPSEDLANRLTKEQADAINALNLPGVVLSVQKW